MSLLYQGERVFNLLKEIVDDNGRTMFKGDFDYNSGKEFLISLEIGEAFGEGGKLLW